MADIFTSVGEARVVDMIDGTLAAPANWYIGWGTGAGTAAKGDTTLFTEAAEARVVTSNNQPMVDKNQFKGTMTSASTQTITNAGLFDAAQNGTLVLHSDFTGVALGTGDKIEFTFTLEMT